MHLSTLFRTIELRSLALWELPELLGTERIPRARRMRMTKVNTTSKVRTRLEEEAFRAGRREYLGLAIAERASQRLNSQTLAIDLEKEKNCKPLVGLRRRRRARSESVKTFLRQRTSESDYALTVSCEIITLSL